MWTKLRNGWLLIALSSMVILAGCGDRPKSGDSKPEPATEAEPTAQPGKDTMQQEMMQKETPPPAGVSFVKKALYPEGLEYDGKNSRYLVTSLREGIVGTVTLDGTYTLFASDNNLVSAIGIRVDSERDRFMVCNSDPGVSVHTNAGTQAKLAGLGVFRLSTGKLMKYVDLGKLSDGNHFCNDIAIDGKGITYVTDSYSPIIYKVDAGFNASILLNNDRFKGEGFNLNGIVHKDDFLIVAKYNEGILFKIPVMEPEKFTQITISEVFPGADGLLWGADGSLIVIANLETNKVLKLNSSDNWVSAQVVQSVDTGPVFATTGVYQNGEVHVLNAMLHILFNPETKEHVETFDIKRYKM